MTSMEKPGLKRVTSVPSYSISLENINEASDDLEKYLDLEAFNVVPSFSGLDKEELHSLLKHFDKESWEKGVCIINEEEEAGLAQILEAKDGTIKRRRFYVIAEGKVEITARKNERESVELAKLGPGKWFGELGDTNSSSGDGLLAKPDMTSALGMQPVTVIALSETVVLSIDAQKCSKILKKIRRKLKRRTMRESVKGAIKKSTSIISVIDFDSPLLSIKQQLRKLPFFTDLSDVKLQQLASLFEFRKQNEKEVICKQGDVADGFYIIVIGTVEILVDGNEGKEIHLNTLSPGDWFGEIALLQKTRRTATVKAVDECTLLFLSGERFSTFLTIAPELTEPGNVLKKLVSKRTANTLKALNLFENMNDKEEKLQILGELFRFVEFETGEYVFKEGEEGDAFFIITSGSAEVFVLDEHKKEMGLNHLHQNDWFGEIALVRNTKRTATVRCLEKSSMLKLSNEDFQSFLQIDPSIKDSVEKAIASRTAKSLKQNQFFESLLKGVDEKKTETLRAMFSFEQRQKGDIIFKQGDLADKFYLIVEGEVSLNRVQLYDAEFEEEEIKEGNIPTEDPVIPSILENDAMVKSIPIFLPNVPQENVDEKDQEKKQKSKMPRDMSFPQFSLIVTDADKQDVINQKMEEQMERANEYKSQLPDVKEQELKAGEINVCNLKNGDFFGTTSILESKMRTSTAKCESETLLASIGVKHFVNFLALAPDIKETIVKENNIRTASTIKYFDLFKNLEGDVDSKLQEIVKLLDYEHITTGDVLFRKGEPGDKMYVVVSGAVRVTAPLPEAKNGGGDEWENLVEDQKSNEVKSTYLNTLRQGAYFGEVSVFRKLPRTATVTAIRPCVLLSLKREKFVDLIKIAPELEKPMSKRIRKRYMHLRGQSTEFDEEQRKKALEDKVKEESNNSLENISENQEKQDDNQKKDENVVQAIEELDSQKEENDGDVTSDKESRGVCGKKKNCSLL